MKTPEIFMTAPTKIEFLLKRKRDKIFIRTTTKECLPFLKFCFPDTIKVTFKTML